MGNTTNYSEFSRQSALGICILYFRQIGSILKGSWILLLLFFKDFSNFSIEKWSYVFYGLLFFMIVFLVTAYLKFKNFRFKIDDDQFILHQGVLSKNTTSISIDRIQNINIKQSLLHQLLNIYELQIDTAGSDGKEITIQALPKGYANSLKEYIFELKNTDSEQFTTAENRCINISLSTLFKVGLSNNHFRSFLLLLTLFFGFYNDVESIIESMAIKDTVITLFESFLPSLTADFSLIIFMVILIILTSIIYSVITTILKHFDLQVKLCDDSYEIRQGLFTKQNLLLNHSKIQYFIVSTNPLKRWLGLSYFIVKQTDNSKAGNQKELKQIKVVGLNSNEFKVFSSSIPSYEIIDNTKMKNSNSYYQKRMLWQGYIFLILLNIFLYFIAPTEVIISANCILVPLIFLLVRIKYKKRNYLFLDDKLILKTGLYETHISYLEWYKIQHVSIKQSIFQRRRELVDLVLQTASDTLTIPCIEEKKANEIFNYVLYKVETETKAWI